MKYHDKQVAGIYVVVYRTALNIVDNRLVIEIQILTI